MHLQNVFRYVAAGVATALLASASLFAQGEEFDFDDIPVDEARQYYVAVGGGYLGMLMFMDFDELNKVSREQLGLSDFEGQLFLNGGGGLISLLVVPNLRFGVYGAGGSRVMEGESSDRNFKRTLRFHSVVTAGQIDYAIRITRSLTALPGVMVGAGSYTLEMSQSQKDGATFGTIFNPGGDQGGNRYSRISRSHLFYYPAVNLEYAITQFVMLRAGAGYSGTAVEGAWKDGAGLDVHEVPAVDASGFTLQFGVFVGLFQNQ